MRAHPVANRPQHSVHVMVDAAASAVGTVDEKSFPLAFWYVPAGRVIVSVCERADG